MGWLRFREGEERRGTLRRWEATIRDHQVLAQLPEQLPALADHGPAAHLQDDPMEVREPVTAEVPRDAAPPNG